MLVNEKKSSWLKLGSRYNVTPANISINNIEIEGDKALKYLGHTINYGREKFSLRFSYSQDQILWIYKQHTWSDY